jgi:CheY-like chemotaxis protein
VLIVDDHPGIRESVAAVLAPSFDVVGAVGDGHQALEAARRLDPDAMVLDVTMPGLDGFQTLRALERSGSRAAVVFLSAHEADEYVREAFRCGGRGFVVKGRVPRDLPGAIDHALAGRLFVPSLTSLLGVAAGRRGHAMQLQGPDKPLLDGLGAFFDLALRQGDATCVIASGAIRDGLAERLRARGWTTGGESGHGRYLAIDAGAALKRFMRDGMPDERSLLEIANELDEYRKALAEGPSQRLTIFGVMAGMLVASGNVKAALALERAWNALTHHLPFFTLCGYASDGCHDGMAADQFAHACAEHWAVGHANGV